MGQVALKFRRKGISLLIEIPTDSPLENRIFPVYSSPGV
jgi:hypothetical protein